MIIVFLSIVFAFAALAGINTFAGFDMFSNPISNCFMIRSARRNIKSSGLLPGWEINKLGSKLKVSKNRYSIYVEISNKITLSWTNDIIDFKKVNGEWVGDFDRLRKGQKLYDNMWNKSNPDRNLENMIRSEDRDRKLAQLGIQCSR